MLVAEVDEVVLVVEDVLERGVAIRLVAACIADDIFGELPELVAALAFPPCFD